MNDEIKEILDSVKLEVNSAKNWIEPLGLNRGAWNKLLDYITKLQEDIRTGQEINSELQQENHELKSKLECYENGAYYSSKVDELEQENERLKQELVKIPRAKMEYDLELEDYKSRCEKAIEYIKNTIYSDITGLEKHNITEFWFVNDLLNILQNGDDNK